MATRGTCGELAGLFMEDVDLGRIELVVPHADADAFWLGRRGKMNGSGIYQMLKRRCKHRPAARSSASVAAHLRPHVPQVRWQRR